jgi:uncharacterized membrane protein YhhN
MLSAILTVLAVISASIHIRAEYHGPHLHIHIFKPLTMVFILLIASLGQAMPLYKCMIIAGLICSMAGDAFLMPPWDRFVAGLVAFLIAHLFYIVAFTSGIGLGGSGWVLIPFVIYGIVIYSILSSGLGKLKLPVIAYIIVILVMAWQAWERWIQTDQNGALLAFVGAVLFVISDTILAINRFRGQFKLARVLNLMTYFAAQWLIAGSAGAIGNVV